MNFRLKKGKYWLAILLLSSVFLASCQFFKKESVTPPEPPKLWKVEKDVSYTSYYDGICGKADEYILLKYP